MSARQLAVDGCMWPAQRGYAGSRALCVMDCLVTPMREQSTRWLMYVLPYKAADSMHTALPPHPLCAPLPVNFTHVLR